MQGMLDQYCTGKNGSSFILSMDSYMSMDSYYHSMLANPLRARPVKLIYSQSSMSSNFVCKALNNTESALYKSTTKIEYMKFICPSYLVLNMQSDHNNIECFIYKSILVIKCFICKVSRKEETLE